MLAGEFSISVKSLDSTPNPKFKVFRHFVDLYLFFIYLIFGITIPFIQKNTFLSSMRFIPCVRNRQDITKQNYTISYILFTNTTMEKLF